MDASVLQQQSPAAPGGAPPIAPSIPQPTGSTQGVAPSATLAPPKEEDSELKIALKAMSGFIGSEGKLRRDLVGARNQGLV